MQKFIRIMAIIAAVLIALSLVLLLGTLPFQRLIAGKLYSTSDDVLSLLPIFPLADFLNCFLLLGCGILLIVCCGSQKGGIWMEILVFAAVALVLPVIHYFLSTLMNVTFGQLRGAAYIAANASAMQIAAMCMWTGNLGRCIAMGCCGMSLVYKRMSKKLAKVTE